MSEVAEETYTSMSMMSNHLGHDDDGKGWIRVTHKRQQRPRKVREYVKEEEGVKEEEANDFQDWSRVVLKRKDKPSQGQSQGFSKGVKRPNPNSQSQSALSAGQQQRLEQSETPKRKELSSESRRKVQQIRFGMGFTQEQLNQMCSFPPNTIRDIEAGHYCPTPKQLAHLSHELKTSLRYDWV